MNLKLLLKRGALIAAANWPTVAIQFVAETAFQVLVAIPILGAAVLVAVVIGTDLAELLQGGLRDIATRIAAALTSEPIALVSFGVAFGITLTAASVLMRRAACSTCCWRESAGAIEREPLSIDTIEPAARFTLERFINGYARLFSHPRAGVRASSHMLDAAASAFALYGFRVADVIGVIGLTSFAAAAILIVWLHLSISVLLMQKSLARYRLQRRSAP